MIALVSLCGQPLVVGDFLVLGDRRWALGLAEVLLQEACEHVARGPIEVDCAVLRQIAELPWTWHPAAQECEGVEKAPPEELQKPGCQTCPSD